MGNTASRHGVAGMVLGLLSGMVLVFCWGAAPFVLLPTIVVALLGAWAGYAAAIAASVSNLIFAYAIGGGTLMLVTLEAMLLPAWGVLFLLARRRRFYEGVRLSAFVQFGALLVLVLSAWIVIRSDLVTYVMGALRMSVDAYPPEFTGSLLSYMGQLGLFGTQSGLDFSSALSLVEQQQVLDALFAGYTRELQLTLPSMLLNSGFLTGAAAYWLCARVYARRGDDPPVSYAHPRDWRLPAHAIIGPPACILASWIAHSAGLSGADAAYIAMVELTSTLFMVQGLGAVDRLLFRSGASKGRRQVTLVALLIIGQLFLPILGIFSALIGSQGLITTMLKKRAERNDKGDDQR